MIVFQQIDSKVAVLVILVVSEHEVIVVSFFCPLRVKKIVQVLLDDLWFPIRTGIVHDETDERGLHLLHTETVHCHRDIGCLVVGVAPYTNLKGEVRGKR